ncbi:hypothetical protein F511_41260 [Dorcoceras hygrometricum]|uniref:Uncharacterized protein n=1 Tax=Dorcoceras hygrometricum TaxID=472368 RepID=A0A2Z7AYJ5_9LAMI|nr:hypothetical protein F511_41260 [Dorcoceras hygrometricum]
MVSFTSNEFSIVSCFASVGQPLNINLKLGSTFLERHFKGMNSAKRNPVIEKFFDLADNEVELDDLFRDAAFRFMVDEIEVHLGYIKVDRKEKMYMGGCIVGLMTVSIKAFGEEKVLVEDVVWRAFVRLDNEIKLLKEKLKWLRRMRPQGGNENNILAKS